MAIIVDNDTRLVVQGLTGSEGRFHGLRNRAYGTNLVAGVTPGKGGQDVEGVPVYHTVSDSVTEQGANTAMIFVPAPFAADAVYEAVDAGIHTVIVITEGVPAHDMLRIHSYVSGSGVTLIGPNCPGALSPGKANVGIIPAEIFTAGNIGLVSRSGTLTYQIGHELTQMGLGNSTIVGIGGDPVVGSSFVDILAKFQADSETEFVVMVGEIGGDEEEKAAAFIEAELTKPVVAYIAGFTAPPGKTMGHAGAIISGSSGTAEGKKAALEAKGIRVGTTPTETAELVATIAQGLGLAVESGQQQGLVDFSGLPQLSVAERVARGKAARREVPRSSHAVYEPTPHRLDPVELLERQAESRAPELVPIRYGRMLASPFTFYRGAALIMAADLAATPRSGFLAQCCGDAHLSNFGLYASPERRLVFDINDFDETLPGPWEWDVKRLGVSMLICSRSSGFIAADQERVVLETVAAYRTRMAEFAGMRNLQVWYTRFEIEKLMPQLRSQVGGKMRKRLDKAVAKAFRRDSVQAFSKLSRDVDGERRIVSDPPLIVRLDDFPDSEERDRLKASAEQILKDYRLTLPHERRILLDQYRLVDQARKVVGVGSVGTAAWVVLLLGRDGRDPLFLQVKEAQRSVMEEFVGRSDYENAGERVVAGQRIMQASSDIFLGWLHIPESVFGQPRDYYVRQLRDWKGSVVVEAMDPRALSVYGQLCAATLAHAHARSGDRIAIASYLGSGSVFERAILSFSEAYAEQNERDYVTLLEAAESGRVSADRSI